MFGLTVTCTHPYLLLSQSELEYLSFSVTLSDSQQGLTSTLSVQDPSQRFKGDVMDLRLDIERRKRFAGREREDKRSPGGSRGPSRDRSSEKSGKRHKKSKYVCFISSSLCDKHLTRVGGYFRCTESKV